MTRTLPIFQVDAFTSQAFGGNPAAVCLLDIQRDESWMQAVAQEMNLSETAFVLPSAGKFDLRWFTPAIEVDLCGHATLASAHVLWEQGILPVNETAVFHTRSGILGAAYNRQLITLDFPATPAHQVTAPDGLLPALGITGAAVLYNGVDYLVVLPEARQLTALQPDFKALAKITARGVMVTSPSDNDDFDFYSRFFGPAAGIDEDPVTGSAHCTLAPYWADRLGKTRMRAYQASQRGGEVITEIRDDRVLLSGQAVTVFKGDLYV